MDEGAVQNHVRLAAAQLGIELWRNNIGVLKDERGVPVRYGLANDSANLNRKIKSSDLIGITPILVTPDMVGQIVGIFTAVEVKESEWVFRPNDEHALAQNNYCDIVRAAGGYAGFATSVAEFRRIVKR